MRNQKLLIIVLTTFISCLFHSCLQTDKVIYKYNGIYKTQQNGKVFSLINDSVKKITIDTVPVITPVDFKIVRMDYYSVDKSPALFILLTETGKIKFAELTRNNIGKPLALILEDKLLSAPTIQSEIPNGQIEAGGLDRKLIEHLVKKFKK